MTWGILQLMVALVKTTKEKPQRTRFANHMRPHQVVSIFGGNLTTCCLWSCSGTIHCLCIRPSSAQLSRKWAASTCALALVQTKLTWHDLFSCAGFSLEPLGQPVFTDDSLPGAVLILIFWLNRRPNVASYKSPQVTEKSAGVTSNWPQGKETGLVRNFLGLQIHRLAFPKWCLWLFSNKLHWEAYSYNNSRSFCCSSAVNMLIGGKNYLQKDFNGVLEGGNGIGRPVFSTE